MNRIILILLFLISLFFLFSSDSTKLVGSNFMVEVDNETGRFIPFGRKRSKDPWIPLLFFDNPPTSSFNFFYKGKKIPFGEGGKTSFSEIMIENNSIVYKWNDLYMNFELIYSLTRSSDSVVLDTLQIDLNINNLVNEERVIDFSFVIDTYLGEEAGPHFILPGNIPVNKEMVFYGSSIMSEIVSKGKNDFPVINIIFDHSGNVMPERLYFTNWKRFERNMGMFEVVDGRNFNLEPFSINDSVVVVEYKDQKINYSRKKNYTFYFSLNSDLIFDIKDEQLDEKNQSDDFESKKTDNNIGKYSNLSLMDLLKLLDSMNEKIESGNINQSDLDEVDEIMEEIESRN